MSVLGPTCTIVASSTAGSDRASTRPTGLTAPTVGTKMVISPRSSEKKSLETTPPGGPAGAAPRAASVEESSPRAPSNHGPRSPRLTVSVIAAVSRLRIAAVLDGQGGRRALEQVAEGGHGRLGLEEIVFQPGQVHGDELVSGVDVRGLQHGADLLQRHVEVAEATDDLCGRDLLDAVTAVARARVDLHRGQEPELVVVPEGLDAEVRGPGEISDGQRRCHASSFNSPSGGESSGRGILDSPA